MNLLYTLIDTERLTLIPTSEDYAAEIFKEFTKEVTQFMYPKPAKDISETINFIKLSREKMEKGEELQMIILDKDSCEFLGHCGITHLNTTIPELGIWIKVSAHGNKYGREAVTALKQWLDTNVNYKYIKYPVDKRNVSSRKIAESLGGLVEAEYEKTNLAGDVLDEVEYRIYSTK